MRTLRLFLPGRFEDAQLYMGHLVLFTVDRDAFVTELEEMTRQLETKYPSWKGLLTIAFARNDWLSGAAVTALARNPMIAEVLNSATKPLSETVLELSGQDIKLASLDGFAQNADTILDTTFYGRRLYISSTAGLFDYDIDWQELWVGPGRRRHDARCVSATAEYGAINASCEDEGLFTGYDEFGWRHSTSNGVGSLTQTAPRSLRSSWYGTDLVNYESPTALELLRASVEEVGVDDSAFGRERKLVTEFAAPSPELDAVLDALELQWGDTRSDLQFVWNSSRAFFINTYQHGFFTATYSAKAPGGYAIRPHGDADGRVVAVHPFSRGWVIETDFSAYVLSDGRLQKLLDDEPLSVRTFAGSKRYRRLIAITVEDGLYLVSAIDTF